MTGFHASCVTVTYIVHLEPVVMAEQLSPSVRLQAPSVTLKCPSAAIPDTVDHHDWPSLCRPYTECGGAVGLVGVKLVLQ